MCGEIFLYSSKILETILIGRMVGRGWTLELPAFPGALSCKGVGDKCKTSSSFSSAWPVVPQLTPRRCSHVSKGHGNPLKRARG